MKTTSFKLIEATIKEIQQAFSEPRLIELAYAYEQATRKQQAPDFHDFIR